MRRTIRTRRVAERTSTEHCTEKDFAEFESSHHAAVIKLVNSNYLNYFDGKALPILQTTADREKFGCREMPCIPTGRLKELMVDQRDRDFSYVVGDNLCDRAGKYSDLVVDVGYNHAQGVKDWLGKFGGGNIKVVQFRSDRAADREAISSILSLAHELPGPIPLVQPANAVK